MELKRKRYLIAAIKISTAVLITAFAFAFLMGTSCGVPDEPKSAKDWYKKGKSYADDEIYGKAIECFTKAIEIDPKHAEAYDYRGYCYYRMVQYEEALADFEMALKLGSKFSEVGYYYMGNTYHEMENYEEAIKSFTKAIEINPEEADYYYDRGSSYYELKLFKKAEADFKEACSLGSSGGCDEARFIYEYKLR